jgi:hypothetical protein
MKKTALLALVVVAVSSPAMAKWHHRHHVYREASHHRDSYREASDHHRVNADKPAATHAHITCDMVRAYVAQVGLVQARAMALSAGMSAAEERRAKQCLENKI